MKKRSIFALSILTCLLLAACNEENQFSSESSSSQESQEISSFVSSSNNPSTSEQSSSPSLTSSSESSSESSSSSSSEQSSQYSSSESGSSSSSSSEYISSSEEYSSSSSESSSESSSSSSSESGSSSSSSSESSSESSSSSSSESSSQSSESTSSTSGEGGQEEPPIEPYQYYLPSTITGYDVSTDRIENVTTYEYDDDLLGYTKTKLVTYDDYSYKDVETVRYNIDFTAYSILYETYDLYDGEYVLDDWNVEKCEYELYGNNSYKCSTYFYYSEISDFYLYKTVTKKYNNHGQLILDLDERPNEENDNKLYVYSKTVYEYNNEGYPLKTFYYDSDYSEEKNLYLHSYDEYIYDENYQHCKMQSYYLYDEEDGLVKDGWTDITITNENGVRKYDEQNYFEDGSLGNHNIHSYNGDFVNIYNYYGGMNEESGITLNENNQIVKYFIKDDTTDCELEAFYDENTGNIVSTSCIKKDPLYTDTESVAYSYNENEQMIKANRIIESVNGEEKFVYEDETIITYTELQNDLLLEKLDYIDDIVGRYSNHILE